MLRLCRNLPVGVLWLCLWSAPLWADYSAHPEAKKLIDEMVSEHDFEREALQQLFAQATRRDNILEAIARPAERVRPWREYRPIFVVPARVENGVRFWQEHKETLARAEQTYGVPASIIVAIIGVETNYGGNMGRHRVLDALATLAFDYPPRSPFFRSELKHYLILTREQGQDPRDFVGSYAGAMGYGQFMPSSYRAYAVDFDGDGQIDIWNNITDAIGSVANYFKVHGWRHGEPVAVRARIGDDFRDPDNLNSIARPDTPLAQWQQRDVVPIVPMADSLAANLLKLDGQHGDEYWFGFRNFYVITRYNRSHMYAMATYHLSRELREQMEAGQ